jgi:hypothetical protein
MDAGFYDDGLFKSGEALEISYACGDKRYGNVIDDATNATDWQASNKDGNQQKRLVYTASKRSGMKHGEPSTAPAGKRTGRMCLKGFVAIRSSSPIRAREKRSTGSSRPSRQRTG